MQDVFKNIIKRKIKYENKINNKNKVRISNINELQFKIFFDKLLILTLIFINKIDAIKYIKNSEIIIIIKLL